MVGYRSHRRSGRPGEFGSKERAPIIRDVHQPPHQRTLDRSATSADHTANPNSLAARKVLATGPVLLLIPPPVPQGESCSRVKKLGNE